MGCGSAFDEVEQYSIAPEVNSFFLENLLLQFVWRQGSILRNQIDRRHALVALLKTLTRLAKHSYENSEVAVLCVADIF